jgi:uncharacterized protein (DUF1015 family)
VNIVRLTLGDRPGERADYSGRARLLDSWKAEGILLTDPRQALYVYGVDYTIPGTNERASFRGLLALGSLHEFSRKVVLPHEQTFPRVVDDRYNLLEATRTHLEQILLLYSDPAREIDSILEEFASDPPEMEVEARPGETHAIWGIREADRIQQLRDLFRQQRPMIADGHHRYTTACRFWTGHREDPRVPPGSRWQPMVLGNLFGKGLSILATHRLVNLGGDSAGGLRILEDHLEATRNGSPDFVVETREDRRQFSIPRAIRASRNGVARSSYAILHDVVLGEWLGPLLEKVSANPVLYFKEGTGEDEALRRGEGDLLIRMQPVDREEFRQVVQGGEVFPHKTTFFYPKLWSGLVLWTMAEPESSGK